MLWHGSAGMGQSINIASTVRVHRCAFLMRHRQSKQPTTNRDVKLNIKMLIRLDGANPWATMYAVPCGECACRKVVCFSTILSQPASRVLAEGTKSTGGDDDQSNNKFSSHLAVTMVLWPLFCCRKCWTTCCKHWPCPASI